MVLRSPGEGLPLGGLSEGRGCYLASFLSGQGLGERERGRQGFHLIIPNSLDLRWHFHQNSELLTVGAWIKLGSSEEQHTLLTPEPHLSSSFLKNFYACNLVLLSTGTLLCSRGLEFLLFQNGEDISSMVTRGKTIVVSRGGSNWKGK